MVVSHRRSSAADHAEGSRHDHRKEYGVELICAVVPIAPSTYYACKVPEADPALRSARALDEHGPEIVAFAWRAYERESRGAVYLDLEALRLTSSGRSHSRPVYLTTPAQISALADDLDLIHGRNIVTTPLVRYAPADHFVCIVRGLDATVFARTVRFPFQ